MENDIRHPEVTDGKHPQSKLPARRRRGGVRLQVGVRRGACVQRGFWLCLGLKALEYLAAEQGVSHGINIMVGAAYQWAYQQSKV
jgi:hypothetical protein